MSIWTRIAEALSALAAGEGLSVVFEKLRTPPERTVAFTIAVIALGAKMAKADGRVTRDEVTAFREVFHIPEHEEQNAARLFNLARTDVAGYDVYARRIKGMYNDGDPALSDLLEGLFHIAVADGHYQESEDNFLRHVAEIFGLDERCFKRIRSQFVPESERDPYDVLGVEPGMALDDIRKIWRERVIETHPDQLMARGVPEEALRLAEKRLIMINRAWEQISEAQA